MKLKTLILSFILTTIGIIAYCGNSSDEGKYNRQIIIRPIIVTEDDGSSPAKWNLRKDAVDYAFDRAKVDVLFTEPHFWRSSIVLDCKESLDKICMMGVKQGIMTASADTVNMIFVRSIDGRTSPQGRGLLNGNVSFIVLGDSNDTDMQTFVITHELCHNLGLIHTVDDPNVDDNIPNIMGDGAFSDRIDPKHSLTDYQIKVIMKSPLVNRCPIIKFPDKSAAEKSIVDETKELFFSTLQKREMSAFIAEELPNNSLEYLRNYTKEQFIDCIRDFTAEEKQKLIRVTNIIYKHLINQSLDIIADSDWKFIKLDKKICGGFAHTRNDAIFFTERHLKYSDEALASLILHEQIHVLQRIYPNKFTELYNQWGFVEGEVSLPKRYITKKITNPDAPVANWIYKTNGQHYWFFVAIKDGNSIPRMGYDFTTYIFKVKKKSGKWRVVKDVSSTNELKHYYKGYNIPTGHDHPNEIVAYMFAAYINALITNKEPFSDWNSTDAQKNAAIFNKWLKQI